MRTLFATVTVYGQPDCIPCERVCRKLEFEGISYDYVDVQHPSNAEARIYLTEVLKARSTPVVVTDTHRPIIGYQPDQLDELIDYYTKSETDL